MTTSGTSAFSTTVEHHKDQLVVSVIGDVDIDAEQRFMAVLAAAVSGRPSRIVVDLTRVQFMDSSGVRCLLIGSKTAVAAAVGFTVRGAQGVTEQVLEITGVLGALTSTQPETAPRQAQRPRTRWGWLSRLFRPQSS